MNTQKIMDEHRDGNQRFQFKVANDLIVFFTDPIQCLRCLKGSKGGMKIRPLFKPEGRFVSDYDPGSVKAAENKKTASQKESGTKRSGYTLAHTAHIPSSFHKGRPCRFRQNPGPITDRPINHSKAVGLWARRQYYCVICPGKSQHNFLVA